MNIQNRTMAARVLIGLCTVIVFLSVFITSQELSHSSRLAMDQQFNLQKNHVHKRNSPSLPNELTNPNGDSQSLRSLTKRKANANSSIKYKKISIKTNPETQSGPNETMKPSGSGKIRRIKPKSSPQTMIYKPLKNSSPAPKAKDIFGLNKENDHEDTNQDKDIHEKPSDKPKPWALLDTKPKSTSEKPELLDNYRPTKRTRIHLTEAKRVQDAKPSVLAESKIRPVTSRPFSRSTTAPPIPWDPPTPRWRISTRKPNEKQQDPTPPREPFPPPPDTALTDSDAVGDHHRPSSENGVVSAASQEEKTGPKYPEVIGQHQVNNSSTSDTHDEHLHAESSNRKAETLATPSSKERPSDTRRAEISEKTHPDQKLLESGTLRKSPPHSESIESQIRPGKPRIHRPKNSTLNNQKRVDLLETNQPSQIGHEREEIPTRLQSEQGIPVNHEREMDDVRKTLERERLEQLDVIRRREYEERLRQQFEQRHPDRVHLSDEQIREMQQRERFEQEKRRYFEYLHQQEMAKQRYEESLREAAHRRPDPSDPAQSEHPNIPQNPREPHRDATHHLQHLKEELHALHQDPGQFPTPENRIRSDLHQPRDPSEADTIEQQRLRLGHPPPHSDHHERPSAYPDQPTRGSFPNQGEENPVDPERDRDVRLHPLERPEFQHEKPLGRKVPPFSEDLRSIRPLPHEQRYGQPIPRPSPPESHLPANDPPAVNTEKESGELDEDAAEFARIALPPSNYGKRIPGATRPPKYFHKPAEHPSYKPSSLSINQVPGEPARIYTPPVNDYYPPAAKFEPSKNRDEYNFKETDHHGYPSEPKDKYFEIKYSYTAKYPGVPVYAPTFPHPPPERVYTPPVKEYQPPSGYSHGTENTKPLDFSYRQPLSSREPTRQYTAIHPDEHRHPTPPRIYEPPIKEYQAPSHVEQGQPLGLNTPIHVPRDINDVRALHVTLSDDNEDSLRPIEQVRLPTPDVRKPPESESFRSVVQGPPTSHGDIHSGQYPRPQVGDLKLEYRPGYPIPSDQFERVVSVGHMIPHLSPQPPETLRKPIQEDQFEPRLPPEHYRYVHNDRPRPEPHDIPQSKPEHDQRYHRPELEHARPIHHETHLVRPGVAQSLPQGPDVVIRRPEQPQPYSHHPINKPQERPEIIYHPQQEHVVRHERPDIQQQQQQHHVHRPSASDSHPARPEQIHPHHQQSDHNDRGHQFVQPPHGSNNYRERPPLSDPQYRESNVSPRPDYAVQQRPDISQERPERLYPRPHSPDHQQKPELQHPIPERPDIHNERPEPVYVHPQVTEQQYHSRPQVVGHQQRPELQRPVPDGPDIHKERPEPIYVRPQVTQSYHLQPQIIDHQQRPELQRQVPDGPEIHKERPEVIFERPQITEQYHSRPEITDRQPRPEIPRPEPHGSDVHHGPEHSVSRPQGPVPYHRPELIPPRPQGPDPHHGRPEAGSSHGGQLSIPYESHPQKHANQLSTPHVQLHTSHPLHPQPLLPQQHHGNQQHHLNEQYQTQVYRFNADKPGNGAPGILVREVAQRPVQRPFSDSPFIPDVRINPAADRGTDREPQRITLKPAPLASPFVSTPSTVHANPVPHIPESGSRPDYPRLNHEYRLEHFRSNYEGNPISSTTSPIKSHDMIIENGPSHGSRPYINTNEYRRPSYQEDPVLESESEIIPPRLPTNLEQLKNYRLTGSYRSRQNRTLDLPSPPPFEFVPKNPGFPVDDIAFQHSRKESTPYLEDLSLLSKPEAPIAVNKDYIEHHQVVPGKPGVDYPIYSSLPDNLQFQCQWMDYPGYYADPETRCQVFHVCQPNRVRDSFLCPNGTIFNQKVRVCDWWYNVRCADSVEFYFINELTYTKSEPLPDYVLH